jgi:hypothetical protein
MPADSLLIGRFTSLGPRRMASGERRQPPHSGVDERDARCVFWADTRGPRCARTAAQASTPGTDLEVLERILCGRIAVVLSAPIPRQSHMSDHLMPLFCFPLWFVLLEIRCEVSPI